MQGKYLQFFAFVCFVLNPIIGQIKEKLRKLIEEIFQNDVSFRTISMGKAFVIAFF